MKDGVPNRIVAQRGDMLRCRGWKQETILRMLENSLENAQDPSRLIVYGGIARAARNWESYHAIVASLKELEDDETLVIQAGMPVAVFRTHRLAPRVVMGLGNVINANWTTFYELMDRNLTTFSSYTAGPWEYIGSQGVVEGTFETLACIAEEQFGGSLRGRVFFSGGLGGMGRSQPKAMTMHGGVSVTVEVRSGVVRRCLEEGWVDVEARSLDEAVAMADKACRAGKPLAIALCANMIEACEEALAKGWIPEIVTEMCPFHDPFAVIPSGLSPAEADALRGHSRSEYLVHSRRSIVRMVQAMNRFQDAGAQVFEYGTFVRKEAVDAGMSREEAFRYPGFVSRYWRPHLFEKGRGAFRWTCISGEAADRDRLDRLALELFPECPVTQRWIPLVREHLPIEGLPARVCFLGFGQRKRFGLATNELIRRGEVLGAGSLLPRQSGPRCNRQSGNGDREHEGRFRCDRGLALHQCAAEHGGNGRSGLDPVQWRHGCFSPHRLHDHCRRQRGGRASTRSRAHHRCGDWNRALRPVRIRECTTGGGRAGSAHHGRDKGSPVVDTAGRGPAVVRHWSSKHPGQGPLSIRAWIRRGR